MMYPGKAPDIVPVGGVGFSHLTAEELLRLTESYRKRFEVPRGRRYRRRERARHWVIFLLLRYTGARVSEVLAVDDRRDLDFRESMVKLPNLKRHRRAGRVRSRMVPLPPVVFGEIGRVLAEFPQLRGRLFACHRSTVYRYFRARAEEAGIPPHLSHPHVLRHTRALELLRAGVPVTVVQELLGHASLNTTALYLRFSGEEIRTILRDRGLI